MTTGKSRAAGRQSFRCTMALRASWRIPKRATTILTSSRRRPGQWMASARPSTGRRTAPGWTTGTCTFTTCEGPPQRTSTLRGYPSASSRRPWRWSEDHLAQIIRRYVGRAAATKAIIHQLNRAEREHNLQNRLQNRQPEMAKCGAGEGNRTLVYSLGSCRSTIELRPRLCLFSNRRSHQYQSWGVRARPKTAPADVEV